jgi:hypothetical protein
MVAAAGLESAHNRFTKTSEHSHGFLNTKLRVLSFNHIITPDISAGNANLQPGE